MTCEWPSVTGNLSWIAKARSFEAIFESAGIEEKIDIVGDPHESVLSVHRNRGGGSSIYRSPVAKDLPGAVTPDHYR
jgi:hypothetical protein